MEEINCITQLENHVGVTYETKYLIMPTSRETILILGMEFLIRYKGKIDIEGVVLTLGKQEYELKITSVNPENILLEKTTAYMVKEVISREISEIIKKAVKNNPPTGEITAVEHEIKFHKKPNT